MKLTILLASLLFAATSAKGVYVEGATTDSSVVEADVAAAKLGANEAPAANHRGLACAGATCPGRRMDQAAEAVVAAAKLGANEAPRRGLTGQDDDQTAEADVAAAKALSVAPSMAPSMAPRRSLAPSCLNCLSDADRLEARCMKSCVANKATCSWYCDLMRKWHYG